MRFLWAALVVAVVSLVVVAVQVRPGLPPVSPPRAGSPRAPNSPIDSRCREASSISRDFAASLPPIYSALFDWLGRKETPGLHGERPAAVVVIETPSLKLPALALSHSSREFPALSRIMRAALADGIDRCIVLDPSRLPAGVVILNAEELGSIGNGRVDWERLARRVPGATGWLGLSQPLLSADRRDAVVYVARYCQGLCGEGRYVWLRHAEDGQWRVSAWLTTWIS